jgi:hypothetical protein
MLLDRSAARGDREPERGEEWEPPAVRLRRRSPTLDEPGREKSRSWRRSSPAIGIIACLA